VTHRTSEPTAAQSAAPAAAASAATAPAKPKPIVDMIAKPGAKPAPAAQTTGGMNDTALELGGGGLALLALGAAAFAIVSSRRRRKDAEAWDYDRLESTDEAGPVHSEPVDGHEPQMIAPEPSAFAWGNERPAANATDDGSDRRPGETWIERAYRGPSPANPSVSLRARLKRAAFFDKREREVAAGTAEPIETDAGLPEAMVEEQETARERVAA